MRDSKRENGDAGSKRWGADVLKGLAILWLLIGSSIGVSIMSMRFVGHREPTVGSAVVVRAPGASFAAQWESCAPIASRCEHGEMILRGGDAGIERRVDVRVSRVDLRFFRGLSIPVLRGRMPVETDCPHGGHEAVLNASAAARFWPDRDPLGQGVRVSLGSDGHLLVKIVGVIDDVSFGEASGPVAPTLYLARARDGSAVQSFLARGVGADSKAGEG